MHNTSYSDNLRTDAAVAEGAFDTAGVSFRCKGLAVPALAKSVTSGATRSMALGDVLLTLVTKVFILARIKES